MSPPTRQIRFPVARYFAAGLLILAFLLGTIWRFSSLHQSFGIDTLTHWGSEIQGHRWTLIVISLVYIAGGLMVFVHAALLWATAFTFDPMHAFLFAETGSFVSAMAVYGLGRILRQDVVDRLAGTYADRLTRALAHRGIWSLMILHWFPIAPFSVLNLISGSTHVRFRDYVIGTIAGMTPGVLLVCFFGHQLMAAIHHPHWVNFMELALFVGIGWVALRNLHKRVEMHQSPIT